MDYQVVWSPEALADVEAIASYIARDSAAYAQAVVEKILETAHQVGEFPFLGRMVPEVAQDTIRERFVYSYRLIYRIRNDTITIAAVIHGRQLLRPIRERLEGHEDDPAGA
jgi:addiction module RelE/StbE family toxin